MAELLKEDGIQTSIHYPPIHHFSAFQAAFPNIDLPVTEEFASRELTLPLYPSLSESQLDAIVSAVASRFHDVRRVHDFLL